MVGRRPVAAAGSLVALALAVALAVVIVASLGQTIQKRYFSAKPDPAPAAVSLAPSPSPSPSTSPSPSPSPIPSPRPSPSPPQPSQVGSPQIFVYISGNDYGGVAALTLTGAVCTASVTMPDGKRTELGARTADQQGAVAWSYSPKSPVAPGAGYHTVTCRLGSQSATGSVSFQPGS